MLRRNRRGGSIDLSDRDSEDLVSPTASRGLRRKQSPVTKKKRTLAWSLFAVTIVLCGLQLLYNLRLYHDFRNMLWDAEATNQFCINDNAPEYCRVGKDRKFKRFIWFVTDGFARNYAQESLAHYQEHSVAFSVRVPGYKFSHAIYTSWLTGKPHYNFIGKRIIGDQLIESYYRTVTKERGPSEEVIRYEGPEWSFLTVAGFGKKEILSREEVVIRSDEDPRNIVEYTEMEESDPDEAVYASLVGDKLDTTLAEILAKDQSLIAHSGIFDKTQHKGVSTRLAFKNDPALNDKAAAVNALLMRLKSFIDDNSEDYILVLSSDHGVDEPNQLHGSGDDGNVGYMMFYNPNLEPSPQNLVLDVVDVAPTICSYLDGVDIPVHSIGATRAWFGSSVDSQQVYKAALKVNLAQLQTAAMAYNVRGTSETLLKELLDDSSADWVSLFDEVSRIKNLIFSGEFELNLLAVLFQAILIVILQLFLVFKMLHKKSIYSASILYVGCYSSFLFVWWRFKHLYSNGLIFLAHHIVVYFSHARHLPDQQENRKRVEMLLVAVFLYVQLQRHGLVPSFVGFAERFLSWAAFCWITSKEFGTRQTIFASIGSIFAILYSMSEGCISCHVYGFHAAALVVYIQVLVAMPYYLYRGDLRSACLPFSLLLLLLYNGSMEIVALQCVFLAYAPKSRRELLPSYIGDLGMLKPISHLARQVDTVYLGVLPLLWVAWVKASPPDFNITPEFGEVGLLNWNIYPVLSSVLMVVAKYGSGFILVLYAAIASKGNRHLIVFYCLNCIVTGLAFMITLRVYSIEHLLEECLALEILQFLTALLYFIFAWFSSAST